MDLDEPVMVHWASLDLIDKHEVDEKFLDERNNMEKRFIAGVQAIRKGDLWSVTLGGKEYKLRRRGVKKTAPWTVTQAGESVGEYASITDFVQKMKEKVCE